MRQLLLAVVFGAALGGAVAIYTSGALRADEGAGIDPGPNREQILKEIDTLRIDGIRHVSEGRYPEAVRAFLRLVDINHHDPFGYQRLAGIASELGPEKFEDILIAEVKGKPQELDLNRTLGAVYFHARKPDLAQKHTEAFLAERPGDLCATYYKGAIARKAGDNQGAIRLLTNVIEEEETYYYAYLELQQAYDDIGNTDMANKMLGLALKNSPKNKEGICCGLGDKKSKKPEDTSA